MVAPQKYRSVFTGQEIDQAVAAMRDSLKINLISNDFTGGTGKIASAELAKILRTDLDAVNTGANIKAKLLSIPDAKVLTDVQYARVAALGGTPSFRGVYTNPTTRDAALTAEVATYTGNEIAFLADDGFGDGISEFSRWDQGSASWKKVVLDSGQGTYPQVIAAASNVNLFSFRANRYSAMKCLVVVSNANGTQKQVLEGLITHIGKDTYISVHNEVGNVSNLFNLSSQYVYSSNLLTTQDFTDNLWASNAVGRVVTQNVGVAPDGSYTAAFINETATTDQHRIGYNLTTAGNTASGRRFSIYAKANGRTKCRGWSWGQASADKQIFTLTGAGSCTGTLNPIIQAVGNGWYRCSFNVPALQADTVAFGPTDATTTQVDNYAGTVGQGILVWGAKLEVGVTATDYIPPIVNVIVQTLSTNLTVSGRVIALI